MSFQTETLKNYSDKEVNEKKKHKKAKASRTRRDYNLHGNSTQLSFKAVCVITQYTETANDRQRAAFDTHLSFKGSLQRKCARKYFKQYLPLRLRFSKRWRQRGMTTGFENSIFNLLWKSHAYYIGWQCICFLQESCVFQGEVWVLGSWVRKYCFSLFKKANVVIDSIKYMFK